MTTAYEALNPWADADPVSLQGISPRLQDLAGKTIGLFDNSKLAAAPMLEVVEQEMKQRLSNVTFSRFRREENTEVALTEHKAQYESWLQGVDAVVFAVGD